VDVHVDVKTIASGASCHRNAEALVVGVRREV
jgi:hypothetical protein